VAPKTLFEKIWDEHVVYDEPGQPALLYVDLHLVHEVTSAQAFEGLRLAGRKVRRPDLTVATADHNVPTRDRLNIKDEVSRKQIETLSTNARESGIQLYGIDSDRQGIVHVIGPELGYTRPGMVIVCGDSHTATHGALGALAMPIGTSQVEHVLATQCLVQSKRDPRGDRQARRRRRHGIRDRIHRARYRGALDGREDDRLQHVDRGRCAHRHDRAR